MQSHPATVYAVFGSALTSFVSCDERLHDAAPALGFAYPAGR
jgi:hypothetical protein